MRAASILAVTLFLIQSCSQAEHPNDQNQVKNIFGEDQRQSVSNQAFPYNAIARLESGCNAYLVAKDFAITAAHCITNKDGTTNIQLNKLRFLYSPESEGYQSLIKSVWFPSKTPDEERAKDWALLELAQAVTHTDAFFNLSDIGADPNVEIAGHMIDRQSGNELASHKDCQVRERFPDGRFFHDCDSAAGISGAPIFTTAQGRVQLVGSSVSEFRGSSSASLTIEEYDRSRANVGLSAHVFAPKARAIIEARHKNNAEELETSTKDLFEDHSSTRVSTVTPRSYVSYDWKPILERRVAVTNGENTFELLLNAPLRYNIVRFFSISPGCHMVPDIQMSMIGLLTPDKWQIGTAINRSSFYFSEVGAAMIKVKFTANKRGTCLIKLFASHDQRLLTQVHPQQSIIRDNGRWSCLSSSPHASGVQIFPAMAGTSLEARIAALISCNQQFGFNCQTTCNQEEKPQIYEPQDPLPDDVPSFPLHSDEQKSTLGEE